MAKWEGGRGPGYADVRSSQLGIRASALGSRRRVGAATVWPVPSPDPRHTLACSDFVPLCSMQEKLWKYTQIKMPLSRVTLPQEKQLSYPTWWSAEAGSVAGCCSCRDSAPRRAPVQERSRDATFLKFHKTSSCIQVPGAGDKQN